MTSINNQNSSKKKIALVHDYMYTYGGAERVFEVMVEAFPDADIYTSYYLPEKMPDKFKSWRIHESFLGKIPFLKNTFLRRYFTFPNFLAMWLLDLKKYDLIISSSSGPAKAIRFRKDAKHICYIHTPHWEAWGIKNSKSIFIKIAKPLLRWLEFWSAQKPSLLLANSSTTQKRIKEFYKRDSVVVYPPIDVERIQNFLKDKSIKKEDFFIMVCRLDLYKGVSIVAKILDKNGYKMKIIGKGEDEKNLVGLSNNIQYLGPVDDETKWIEMAKAKAFIMWNVEDFGITMVESLACGTPVIALGKGGSRDIIEDEINGIFFERQTEEDLIDAIKKLKKTHFDQKYMVQSVQKFSRESFRKKLKEISENL